MEVRTLLNRIFCRSDANERSGASNPGARLYDPLTRSLYNAACIEHSVIGTRSGTFKAPLVSEHRERPNSLTAFPQLATPFAFSYRANRTLSASLNYFIRGNRDGDMSVHPHSTHATHNSHTPHTTHATRIAITIITHIHHFGAMML
jgi:hypothetical protein